MEHSLPKQHFRRSTGVTSLSNDLWYIYDACFSQLYSLTQSKPGETLGRRATGLKDISTVSCQPGRQRCFSGGFFSPIHGGILQQKTKMEGRRGWYVLFPDMLEVNGALAPKTTFQEVKMKGKNFFFIAMLAFAVLLFGYASQALAYSSYYTS